MISEALNSTTLYLRDTAPYQPSQTEIDERDPHTALVQRAKEGDEDARHAIILSLQNYLQIWATRFVDAYAWANQSIDYLELISIGNETLVTRFTHALSKEQPYFYLASAAKWSMRSACLSSISHATLSLDTPFYEGSKATLSEQLAAPPVRLPAPTEASDTPSEVDRLTLALPLLTERMRSILIRLYGLGEHAPELPTRIGESLTPPVGANTVLSLRKHACARLRSLLENAPKDERGAPQVYTLQEARRVLGVNQSNFNALLKKYQVRSCSRGMYAQRDIARIAEQRAGMLAERERLRSLSPEEKAHRERQLQRAREARFLAKKRARQEAV